MDNDKPAVETDDLLKHFKRNISLGNVLTMLLVVFLAGGAWYSLPQRIEANTQMIQNHIDIGYESLEEQADQNTSRIINMETSNDALRELIEQQQRINRERYERIEARLDYIINRIDENQ